MIGVRKMKFEMLGYKINITKEDIPEEAEAEIKKALETLQKYSIDKQVSILQKQAMKKATQSRTDKAKRKIENAINLLRLEGKNISEYAIAKKSGCSINTVKKYREFIQKQK